MLLYFSSTIKKEKKKVTFYRLTINWKYTKRREKKRKRKRVAWALTSIIYAYLLRVKEGCMLHLEQSSIGRKKKMNETFGSFYHSLLLYIYIHVQKRKNVSCVRMVLMFVLVDQMNSLL